MLYVEPVNSVFKFAEDMEIIQAFADKHPTEFETYRISGWSMVHPDRCGEQLKRLLPKIRERLYEQAAKRNK